MVYKVARILNANLDIIETLLVSFFTFFILGLVSVNRHRSLLLFHSFYLCVCVWYFDLPISCKGKDI